MSKPEPDGDPTPPSPATQPAPSEAPKSALESGQIPTASVESRLTLGDLIRGSKLWVLTLGCLLLAIGLAWWSLPTRGIEIVIHFPEGHGLEAEDVVRFRGIEVGEVTSVSLNSELNAVDVTVQLKPSAKSLARQGTRFWIVRPELSISRISGLETAVGHKYVGLMPGEPGGTFQREFQGLDDSPPDAMADHGIELVFRGEKRFSVSAGSPVTFRGVEIGRILSVGLSSDSRHVDIRARIYQKHKQLITSNTVVWANSGVNLDFKFGQGLMLNTESLETIARGGVSVLTIQNGGHAIHSGHVFELHGRPEEGWLEAAKNFRATKFDPRGAIPLQLKWTSTARILGGQKDRTMGGVPIVDRQGKTALLVPGDIYELPRKLEAGSLKIGPAHEMEHAIVIEPDEEKALLPLIRLPVPKSFCSNWLAAPKDFRNPENPEDCVAVRGSMPGSVNSAFVTYSIDPDDIDENWQLTKFSGDESLWHGTPILSNVDGKIIGVLSVTGRGQAMIQRIDPELL